MFKHKRRLKSAISLVLVGVITISVLSTGYYPINANASETIVSSIDLVHSHTGSAAANAGCYTTPNLCGGAVPLTQTLASARAKVNVGGDKNQGLQTYVTYGVPAGYNILNVDSWGCGTYVDGVQYGSITGIAANGAETTLWYHSQQTNVATGRGVGSFNVSGYASIRFWVYCRTGYYSGYTWFDGISFRGSTYKCSTCGKDYGATNPGTCTEVKDYALSCGMTEGQSAGTVNITKSLIGSDYQLVPSTSGLNPKCTNVTYLWNTGSTGSCVVTANDTYTVTVNYNDNGTARTATGTIIVTDYDTIPPTITNVTPSNSSRTNDDIVLTVAATDNFGVTGYSIDGLNFIVDNSFTVTSNGTYSLYARDAVGNISNPSEITVSNIDKAAPDLSVETSPTLWTIGDVTVTATATDNASVGGTPSATIYYSIDGSTYQTNNVFTVLDNCSKTMYVKDDCGNVTSKQFTVSVIDKVKPSVSLTSSLTTPTNTDITLNATASDSESGLATLPYSWDGGVTYTASNTKVVTTNGLYSVTIKDSVGNTSTDEITVSNIDKILPSIGDISFDTLAPCNTQVVVTIIATDIGLGLATSPYKFGSDAYKSGNTYTITENGTYSITVIDKAGNEVSETFDVSNLDFNKPIISSLIPNTTSATNLDVAITVNAFDSESGLDESAYRLQGYGDWQESNILSVDSNASYTIEVRDKAGNIESESIDVTNIDKVPPTAGHVLDITGITSSDVTAALTILDDVGILQVETYDGEVITNSSFTSITDYTFIVNGSYDFTITDTAGNITVHTIVISNIDKIKAEIDTITFSTLQPSNSYIDVLVNAHDIGLGLEPNAYNFNGEGYSNANVYRVNSNGVYSLEVIDLAGNVTTDSFTVSNLDFDVPIIDGIDRLMSPVNTNLEVIVSAHDVGVADLDDTAYRLDTGTYASPISIGNWQSSDTFSIEENGDYTIHIRDAAGNETYQEFNVNNIDKISPVATSSVNDTSPTKDSVLVTLDLSDNVSIKSVELPDGTMLEDDLALADYIADITSEFTDRGYPEPVDATFSSGLYIPYVAIINGSYDFTITDTAGNITVHTINISNIDKSPAEITTVKSTPDWTPNGYDLLVTFKDDTILRTISIDGAVYDLESGEYPEETEIISNNGSDISEIEVTISVSENGIHELMATDFSYNLTESSIEIENIDNVLPTLIYKLSTGSKTNGNVVANLTASDLYGEVDYILFPDGSRSYNKDTNYTMTENGNYAFKVYDKAGNFYDLTISITNIDRSVPSVSWTLEEGILAWSNKSVTLLVTASDDSAIKSMLLIGSSKTFTGKNGRIEVTENGTYILEVADSAGNVYAKKIVIFNIDVKAPNVSAHLKNIYWLNNSNVIVIDALDNESGVVSYSMDGLNWQSSNEFGVDYVSAYTVYAKDAVGNISSVVVNFPLVTAKKSVLKSTNINGIENELQQLDDDISESESTTNSPLWDSYSSYNNTFYDGGNDSAGQDSNAETETTSTETVTSETNVEIIAQKLYGLVSDVTETVIVVVKQTYPALIILFALTLGLLSLFILTNGVKVYALVGSKWKYVGLAKCKSTSSGYSVKLTRKLVRGLSDNNGKIRFSSRYARLYKSSDISIHYGDISITNNLQRNVEFSLFKSQS